MPPGRGRLTIESMTVCEECAVLRVSGELDHSSEPLYLDRIGAVVTAGYRYLVLDVTALIFCDSRGLNCLLALRWLLHRRDGKLLLASVGRHLSDLLVLTGSHEALPTFGSVSEALDSVPQQHRPTWPPGAPCRLDLSLKAATTPGLDWETGLNSPLPGRSPEESD